MARAANLTPTAANILNLLPKLTDADADLRYMALNDLHTVLEGGAWNFLLSDYHTCAKTTEFLLKALDDSHGDVQNQAIKCLGALTLKIPFDILVILMDKLTNLKTTNSVDNSIHTTAIRKVILSLPHPINGIPPSRLTQDGYAAISKILIPRLVGQAMIPQGQGNQACSSPGMLETDSEKGVNSDAIDVLVEVIRCFGPLLQDAEKQSLQNAILTIFDSNRIGFLMKKKAVIGISNLAFYLSDRSLSAFMSSIIERLQTSHISLANRRLLITMLGSLAQSIPEQLGPYLKTLAPLVLSALNEEDYEQSTEQIIEVGEVREAALVTLERFLSLCSSDMRMFTEDSIFVALQHLTYDPNVAIDHGDEDMGVIQGEELDDDETNDFDLENNGLEEDFEEEEQMSGDEDDSWKVRRCAAKLLYTIISTRRNEELLENGTLYEKIAPILIKRFNEREENVRLEVMAALASLILRTGEGKSFSNTNQDREFDGASSQTPISRKRRRAGSDADSSNSQGTMSSSISVSSPATSPFPLSGPKADLARLCPSIVDGVAKLFRHSSALTRQSAITILRYMVLVQHGGLSEQLSKIADAVVDNIEMSGASTGHSLASLGSGTSTATNKLRIEALQLIGIICNTHSLKVLSPHMDRIVRGVANAAKDPHYKISGEAVHVFESIVKALTPPRSLSTESPIAMHLEKLYKITLDRARVTDVDVEVRQRAIHALGFFLARTSGLNGSKALSGIDKSSALSIIQDRIKNETTRLSAVQAIDMITASTKDKNDLQPDWIQTVALELGAQLRKSDRILRGTSLAALRNMTSNSLALSLLDDGTVSALSSLLLPLLNQNDLNLLGLTLQILTSLVNRSRKTVADQNLDDALCNVVLAPLSEAVMESFLGLVKAIGEQGQGRPLMQRLLVQVGISGDPAIVGKAIGTLLVSGTSTVGIELNDFALELQSSEDEQRKCLALSVLGEAGLRLGSSSYLQPQIFTDHFHSYMVQVPRAAAVALGRAGAGNINTYLPVILSISDIAGSSQYLSLLSIKEILQHAVKARTDISSYTKHIWEKLLVASQDEDNKTVGAECIGRLAIMEPTTFLPLLQNYLHDPVPTVRGMVIQAVRYTFADSDEAFDEILKPTLIKMLTTMLTDLNLENRRLALGALNSATHSKPDILLPHLAHLLPLVLKESKLKPELVRLVQMGPFKHRVDDGLEVRKSAYETLYFLMDSAYTRISPVDLFDRVVAGLEDEHVIKVLCCLMLTKLIVLDPEESSRRLDSFAPPFRTIVTSKPKENAIKQEVEKVNEACKAVLKVTIFLHNAFPMVSSSATDVQGQTWKAYWEWVEKDFRPMIQAINQEVKSQASC